MGFTIRTATPDDAARRHELHTAAVREMCAPYDDPNVIEGWLASRTPAGDGPWCSHALAIARRAT